MYCNYCGKKQVKEIRQATIKVPRAKKLSSGNWFIRLRIGGKDIGITKATKDECEEEALKIKTEQITGKRRRTAGNYTVGEIVDMYIDTRRSILSPSTIRGYVGIRRNRFQRAMKLLPDMVDWDAEIAEETKRYSKRSVKGALNLISSAFEAVGEDKPKMPASIAAARSKRSVGSERNYLLPQEVPAFLSMASQETNCSIALMLALNGLRFSEILGLTWSHIDLKDRTITVSGAMVPDEHNQLVRKSENKTALSTRVVPILIESLYSALQNEAPNHRPSDPVFNFNQSTLRRAVKRIGAKINVPHLSIQGLRKSFASISYYLNIPERITMQRGGWSSPKVLHEVYTEIYSESLSKADLKLQTFFSAP